MQRSYWLAVIGGFIGILSGALVAIAGYYVSTFDSGVSSGELYLLATIAIFFSILGIVGGHMQHDKRIGGVLMIVSGIGVLISISLLGIFTFILFLVGGLLMLSDASKERRIGHPMYPMSSQPQTVYRGQASYQSQRSYQALGGTKFCPNCGTPVEMAGQQTCKNCGYKFG
jgi:hypothetical protein